MKVEEDRGEADGEEVGDRLGEVDGGGLVAEEMRQDVDERDEEDEFPHDGDGDGGLRVAEGGEGDLAGALDAEEEEAGQVDAKRLFREGDELRGIREEGGERRREELNEHPEEDGIKA